MIVLIPAYEPGPALVTLVRALAGRTVLVVDDGSGPSYAPVFTAARGLGAEVLTLDRNRGKGFALKAGFAATRVAFRLITGIAVGDTQTGLRAYPAALLPWLVSIRGDRFEYEQNVLLRAAREAVPITEVPIATVYLAGNASSHFRPFSDSLRVYRPLLSFAASSLLAFAVDLSSPPTATPRRVTPSWPQQSCRPTSCSSRA